MLKPDSNPCIRCLVRESMLSLEIMFFFFDNHLGETTRCAASLLEGLTSFASDKYGSSGM